MRKIVITGATSFLGAAMVEKCLKHHDEVYAVVRKNSSNLYRLSRMPRVNIIELNLDEIDCLPMKVDKADVFIHFAWDGSGSEGRKDSVIQGKNYDYAMKAVEAAKQIGCKLFIFPGSQAEYGKVYTETREDMVCNPVSEYGKNKLRFAMDAKELLQNSDMRFLHLRIYSVYGKNDRPGTLIESCINAFQQGGCIELGVCTQEWNYLYIDDFTMIVSKLIEREFDKGDLQSLYNIGGPETKQLKRFVEDIYNATDKLGEYKLGVRPENAEGSPPLVPNLERIRQVVDFESLTSFEDGVEKLIMDKYGKKCIVCGRRLGNEPLICFENMPASAQNMPKKEELKDEKAIGLNLYQCDGCGLVQFDCAPVDYYKDVIRSGGYSTTMVELRRRQYKHLIENYHLQGKDFLEVGCGQGEFMDVLTEFPVNPYGIENRAELVEIAKNKGLQVEQGFITDEAVVKDNKKYGVFLSFNFLEHQPDPNAMLQAIYNKLSDDGMGLITVPSFEYILQYDGYYELIRDHIAYYTFDSLRVLLEKNGFEVLEQEIVNRDTLSVIVRKRKKISLDHWKVRFGLLEKEFKEFLQKYKQQGKNVAVWGASHQGFTIVASLEVGQDLEYIVDSAPFKQGRYAPASHVRIVAPQEFYDKPTDAIIIIAPGYTDEIKNNIQNKCGNGVDIYTLRTEHIERIE